MCEFGMYRCALCLTEILETHIVCDYARAKNWWCEKQFAKCPHRESWYPPPLPACGPCLKQEIIEKAARKEIIPSVFGSGVVTRYDAREANERLKRNVILDDEGALDEDATQGILEWWRQTEGGSNDNEEGSSNLGSNPALVDLQKSESLQTAGTTDTTWEQVETAGGVPERSSSVRVREALRDAKSGVSTLWRNKWYRRTTSSLSKIGLGK